MYAMDTTSILKTALAEHGESSATESTLETLVSNVETQLKDLQSIPAYHEGSEPLSLVSFRCMLQDTGYPMEVYMPASEGSARGEMDLSKLKERWIGWAVEVPGEQSWSRKQEKTMNGSQNTKGHLPKEVYGKYPIPDNEGTYLGALVKVYDEGITFRPATVHTFIGVLSTAPLPSAIQSSDEDSEILVPAIHVIKIMDEPTPPTIEDNQDVVSAIIDYLSTAFNPPDRLAGELLFLSLLSSPSVRPTSLPPLGTLSLNLLRKDSSITGNLEKIVSSMSPRVVYQPLSLSLLHSASFSPSSTDASLESGLLQLAPGTVLLVGEDEMGQGGQLQEKAVKNLRALIECAKDQTVRYEYPYMDGLKMECSIRVVVLSEGKSLIPVDINLPIASDPPESTSSPDLDQFRQYLATSASPTHAANFNIPDEVAQAIQDDFVSRRKDGNTAEEGLKRRMRLARLMAISTPDAKLDMEVWKRVLDLDKRLEVRLQPPTAAA